MGTQSTVYGRITVSKDFDKIKTYFDNLPYDATFPYIPKDIFMVGQTTEPIFRDELIITFGATYKAVEDFWPEYILRFERILKEIEFISVVMHLETEFMGTYCFYWKSKKPNDIIDSRDRWIEMPNWYFGTGNRDMWGYLLELDDNKQEYPFGFSYPVQPDHAV
ncbi:hypothetical protein M0L20_28465 [Spirosoma sp. RP8]|uniref:Uncharacterized protein n=1 Tax=Spirosoma liriopis TaxID=2937440 RepID=A0ABT0HW46_9BACT|nr:hypothetical protein [Spirosoma liriopis]MCK8495833.1 hypothetical protein [Spirosoma liriopis]